MARARAAMVDSALALIEAVALGTLLMVFGIVWLSVATVRVILSLPASIKGAPRRAQRPMIAASRG